MIRLIAALMCGLIFSVGLAVSGMLNPAKVNGFLDIFGLWDPSLAFVMAGGILVNMVGLRLVFKRSSPLLSDGFNLPIARAIDKPLIIGSLIFGVGWGLAGLCPGPVIASLGLNPTGMLPFLGVMIGGMLAGRFIMRRLTSLTNAKVKG